MVRWRIVAGGGLARRPLIGEAARHARRETRPAIRRTQVDHPSKSACPCCYSPACRSNNTVRQSCRSSRRPASARPSPACDASGRRWIRRAGRACPTRRTGSASRANRRPAPSSPLGQGRACRARQRAGALCAAAPRGRAEVRSTARLSLARCGVRRGVRLDGWIPYSSSPTLPSSSSLLLASTSLCNSPLLRLGLSGRITS